jgi:DNA-binding LytR/AlgR family response regulator
MRVLIVDDEPAARRRLSIMLDELDVEVVGEAGNGVEALELVREREPDVLLLDIAMPEVDGFDVARHLDDPKPLIIFQTAFDEYALQAFEHEALDYVVKPVTLSRLDKAIGRARARLGGQRPELDSRLLERLYGALAGGAPARRPRLLVREGAARRLIPFAEISRFTTKQGLVRAHTPSRDYLTDYTLSELEKRTAGSFLRVSRSELVNVDQVDKIRAGGDGSATLTLADGTVVRVTRRRAAEVKRALAS